MDSKLNLNKSKLESGIFDQKNNYLIELNIKLPFQLIKSFTVVLGP